MKKIFSLFAAVLMAGSMMAEAGWIKFSSVQPATEVAGSTYGSDGFTLVIPTESDKATVDANSCTFGLSAEETVSFTHRLKTGGASNKDGRKFTLNIPEEGPLAIYARSSSKDATNRNIVIANGSDTIVNHICLDTDTVEGASSKIFLPIIVENVPAGTYTLTYPVDGINIYGFQMDVEAPAEGWDGTVTLSKTTFTSFADLEGLQLTFNGAISVDILDDEEAGGIIFQNEDGSDIYAAWGPAYGGTSSISGNVVTLNGWYTDAEMTSPLPTTSGSVYFEDYGNFIIDGEDEIFETIEAAFEAAPAVTYTVNYTVNGFDAEHCLVYACYYNVGSDNVSFEPGANTVPENMLAYISTTVIDGYTVEVKVNGAVVTLTNGNWEDDITADMTIEVTFTAPAAINYWLVGPAAENGWDQTKAMPMPGDSIVRHLNAGTYEFKVLTQEGSWTGALGFANLNAEASSANVFGDDNVCFELENEGDVTIKVVEGQIVLLGTFKEQVAYDYYIKFAGNNWTWVGMTQAPSGVYMYEGVWGGTGANVNTQNNNNGAVWYPEADIFFGTEEMEELPVPAVGTVGYYVYIPDAEPAPMLAFLYEGQPTGLQNVKAEKAVKVIENGQVVIIREGVRYNAVGAKL